MTRLRNLLVLVFAAVGIALISSNSPITGQESQAQPEQSEGMLYVVEMFDFYNDPPGLLLEPGDRVIWIMLEDHLADGHSATSYHPEYDKQLRIPNNALSWSTPLMERSGEWAEIQFVDLGVHDYFCIPHETEGMVGRIIVGEPQGGPGTQPGSVGMSAAAQSAIPTIDEIMGVGGQIFNTQGLINTAVFYLRESSAPDARAVLIDLENAILSGEGDEASLYEALSSVDMLQPVLDGIEDLRESIAPGFALGDLIDLAEEVKLLLDEANLELVLSGSGA